MPRSPTNNPNSLALNPAHNEEKQILSVSALARGARVLLEQKFANIWVEGELSNFSRPRSGHWYFTLKDNNAQIRCAMFANRNRAVRQPIRDGMNVLVRGRVSLYEGRGDFQIIVDHLEPAGEGALRAAYEALKDKLASAGLFEPERKRALALQPRHIAIISSATGAALRDVLNVIGRRYPSVQVTLLPVAVQGPNAEPEILAAFDQIEAFQGQSQAGSKQTPLDAVLLTRGGGSLEDLWAFNLESIAVAISACSVPVVSAIGHQTDFAISDFVADVRAPTPSAAAELMTPDTAEVNASFSAREQRLASTLAHQLRYQRQRLSALRQRLIDPKTRLQQQQQRVDEMDQRLTRGLLQRLRAVQDRYANTAHRLQQADPTHTIEREEQRLQGQRARLGPALQRALAVKQHALESRAQTLDAVNPLRTLSRGYAIISADGITLESVTQLQPGQRGSAHLADGAASFEVLDVRIGEDFFHDTQEHTDES